MDEEIVSKMGRKEAFAKALVVQKSLEEVWSRLVFSCSFESTVQDLMLMRSYDSEEMFSTLSDIKVFRSTDIATLLSSIQLPEGITLRDLGLVSADGFHLLNGRYVIPVRSITSKITALVGWYPDMKRYITTQTFGFSKNTSFYNIEHALPLSWSKFGGAVFLVEGIYDTIALRSLGLPVLGNQGIVLSNAKIEILKFFKNVIAIPDGDASGAKVLPSGERPWNYPATFLQLVGVKDVDDLVKGYDSVKESLLGVLSDKRKLIKWDFTKR